MRGFSDSHLLTVMGLVVVLTSSFATAQFSRVSKGQPEDNLETTSSSMPSLPIVQFPVTVPAIALPSEFASPAAPMAPNSDESTNVPHAFWDRKNEVLFAASAAAATADFFVTRTNLANGGRELNPLVRPFAGSTAALATNFALESAGAIAISYMFHKTGHHKMERLAPLINISASSAAVAYGIRHR